MCRIVRELLFRIMQPDHSRSTSQFQHKGIWNIVNGRSRTYYAREEHFSDKISVISGVGTRHYYRKLGYHLDGVYMSKELNTLSVCCLFNMIKETHIYHITWWHW